MTWTHRPAASSRPAVLRTLLLVLAGVGLTLTGATLGGGQAHAAVTCSLWWTGSTDTSWTVAANWSTTATGSGSARTPVSSDVVCMSPQAVRTSVTYTSLTRTVAGIDFGVSGTVAPKLTIDGGRLTVGSGSGSVSSTINDLTILEGGTLQGTADHLLTGNPALAGNAVLDGQGTTTLAAGTTVNTDGLVISGGRTLLVQGILRHTGCYDYVYVYGGSVLENANRIVSDSDCGMRIYADDSDGSVFRIDAGATFEIDQAATESYLLEGSLENHGTVSVATGSLVVAPRSTVDGAWFLGSSAELRVAAGGNLRLRPGTLSGRNAVTVAGGTLTVDSGVSVGAIDLRSGRLSGSPTVSTFTAGPGTTITGGGVVTIASGGTGSVDGLTVETASELVNRGTLTHTGCTAPLALRTGAKLRNFGQFTIACQSQITDDGSAGALVRNEAGGVLTVTMPSGTKIYTVSADLTNDGTISLTLGQLEMPALTNLVAGTLTGGTYNVTGGKMVIPGNITTNAATVKVIGPGELFNPSLTRAFLTLRTNSGSFTIFQTVSLTSTGLTNTGSFTVQGSTFTPKTYTQTAGTTTVVSGAMLTGGNGPGTVMINGGTVTGGGRLSSLAGGGTTRPSTILSMTGQYNPATTATLQIDVNSGTSAGRVSPQGSAAVTGRLNIVTKAGFTPANGTSWTILTTSRRTGEFTQITGDDLPGNLYYGVTYGTASITLTVKRTPSVTVADGVTEIGPAGEAPMSFLATLDEPSTRWTSVEFATVEGTAVAGQDYQPAVGTLSFPPGTTSQTVLVMIEPDVGWEPQETFTLDLSNPIAGILGRDEATGWINHAGDAPAVPVVTTVGLDTVGLGAVQVERTVTGANFQATSEATVTGSGVRLDGVRYVDPRHLVITVSTPSAATVGDVDVTVTNPGLGSATCVACLHVTPRPQPLDTGLRVATGASGFEMVLTGTDFSPAATARITGGTGVSATSEYVSPTEIRLTVAAIETATQGAWDVRVTNADDGFGLCTGCITVNPGPTLVSMSPSTVARGSTSTVTFTGTGFVAGATLTPAVDVTFGAVTVLDGTRLTATMTVAPTRVKGTAIPVTVVNPVGAGSGTAKCLCLQVDTMISAADTATTVGQTGAASMLFDVRLDAASSAPVTVDYSTMNGTAVAGADYTAASGTLSFPTGTTSQTVAVTVLPDTASESDETFSLALSNPTGGSLATTQAGALIRHNEGAIPAPILTGLSPGTVGVGATSRRITLTGAHFQANSQVTVAGTGVVVLTTEIVSAETIRVTLSTWATVAPGVRDITVTTPQRGSSTCTGCLRITPAPRATVAAPSLGTGATERLVTVTGTGFVDGAVAAFRGGTGIRVVSTTVISPTSLQAVVTVATTATTGTWDVRVTNVDGGTSVCLDCFTVLVGPRVLSMTPPVLLRGTTVPVTILGSGFAQGAVITGPPGVRFTSLVVVGDGLITALATVDASRGRGENLPITVVNPAAAGYGQGTCNCLSVVTVLGQ